jgi:sulfur relay (sulfurtransferase) complex TusBCD TusD component (DsrE family)
MRAARDDRKRPGARRLGILILSRQSDAALETVCGLCRAARVKGVEVQIFLMGDGVHHLPDPRMAWAAKDGARVRFCALNAVERGLDLDPSYPWGAEESSQYELACIVEASDRFLALT